MKQFPKESQIQILQPEDVLEFWFSPAVKSKWYAKDEKFDALIRDRFMVTYEAARTGKLDVWQQTPQGALALVIVLDQFSRNMFRGSKRMYESDLLAVSVAKAAIEKGYSKVINNYEQNSFLFMPLMHSEVLADQDMCCEFHRSHQEDSLGAKYASDHRAIIARFGRFPHRNKILERDSTAEEIEFLNQPGSSF